MSSCFIPFFYGWLRLVTRPIHNGWRVRTFVRWLVYVIVRSHWYNIQCFCSEMGILFSILWWILYANVGGWIGGAVQPLSESDVLMRFFGTVEFKRDSKKKTLQTTTLSCCCHCFVYAPKFALIFVSFFFDIVHIPYALLSGNPFSRTYFVWYNIVNVASLIKWPILWKREKKRVPQSISWIAWKFLWSRHSRARESKSTGYVNGDKWAKRIVEWVNMELYRLESIFIEQFSYNMNTSFMWGQPFEYKYL